VTVLFTSHNVQHALHFGDRVLGLKGGRMAMDAAAADVSAAEMGRLYA
jgi:phosphonate transport system ATP-binding protein